MISTSRRSRTQILDASGNPVSAASEAVSLDLPSSLDVENLTSLGTSADLSTAILELAKSPTLDVSPTIETLLQEFSGLVDSFVEHLKMIIEAIIKALSQLIDSLFGQLTTTANTIAQYLDMTPEEHESRFFKHLARIGEFVRQTSDKGFPYNAVDPLKILKEAQDRLIKRSREWFVTSSIESLAGAPLLSLQES